MLLLSYIETPPVNSEEMKELNKFHSLIKSVIEKEGENNYLIEFHNGNHYLGEYVDGALNGLGQYHWNNGVNFNGDFKNNKIDGKGAYKWCVKYMLT